MRKQKASTKSKHFSWAEYEFAHCSLPDRRLEKRLVRMATDFAEHPTAPIPQACGSWSQSKAAYRFFDNDSVTPQAILAGHTEATLQRMQDCPVVLCLQDTTALNYSTHPQTKGLGPIAHNRNKTIGFFLHTTFAVKPSGEALGILHTRTWSRTGAHFGRSSHARNRTPRPQKESQKWMDSLERCQQLASRCEHTVLVNISDREGDLYDAFEQALAPGQGPQVHLLVRAQHNRRVDHPQQYLWEQLSAQRVSGHLEVQVPAKEGQRARVTQLAIRFTGVTLQAPCLKQERAPLRLWAVEARELHPPAGAKAICWRLLTTMPVEDFEAACQKVEWYARRWQIEVLHKVLKSGCQIEQRQLESAPRLERVLMLDLIVAWRVMNLCRAAREKPDAPVTQWLAEAEWRALRAYLQGPAEKKIPNLRQAVRWIAQLGGFLARKSDGEPGPIVLWRGLAELKTITSAWLKFTGKTYG